MMAKKSNLASQQTDLFEEPIHFGSRFLRDHAGQIMTDPRIALTELVANAYDAGAPEVNISLPISIGEQLTIADKGTGLTAEQFNRRWKTLSYNRLEEQGVNVEFPPNVKKGKKRTAFGQSGKGRHGAFCFADEYTVETSRDGRMIRVKVSLTEGGDQPFSFEKMSSESSAKHGTTIKAIVSRKLLKEDDVITAIGSKFLVDPSFVVRVNGKPLELLKLPSVEEFELLVEGIGKISILHIDPQATDRTTHLRGITWWVNDRMVGTPSWDGLDDRGAILDGRRSEAKRFSFVVKMNKELVKNELKPDWSGFYASDRWSQIRDAVRAHIIGALNIALSESRRDRKRSALTETAETLGNLPVVSKRAVSEFADEVLEKCPTISQGDLTRTIEVFASMEKSRSGYDLLSELAVCSPEDLDRWTEIMRQWTAGHAEAVLGELHGRLKLLDQLEKLVSRSDTDELHDLQPLFERGLWIFGPEYEAVDFRSNRSLATSIQDFLGGKSEAVQKTRPDFVALADRSIGIYAKDGFDDDGEVQGIDRVLVVELKRGGSTLSFDEVAQPERYVEQLRSGRSVDESTRFDVFVLGTELASGASHERKVGDHLKIRPLRYERIIKRANARTFHLLEKIRDAFPGATDSGDIDEILAENDQGVGPLYENVQSSS
tara:strand:- start:115 stop:2094 length:1980 start_codon:yes stop_codon:yes gene_type:complete